MSSSPLPILARGSPRQNFSNFAVFREAPCSICSNIRWSPSNGSDHRRRRSAFSTAFAFRAMTDLRPYIRKVADELIDSFYAEEEIDFLSRYASQLPACLIGHILGMPSRISLFSPSSCTRRPESLVLDSPPKGFLKLKARQAS